MRLKGKVSRRTGIRFKSFYIFLVSAFCVLGFMQQRSFAVPIFGNGPLGSFTGKITYDQSNATLGVEITNTPNVSNGGYITAIAFNNPFDSISGVSSFARSDSDFQLIGGSTFNNSIKAVPYGHFDIGASLSNKFLGGGNPQHGIGVGATETFNFTFQGTGLGGLNVEDFLKELSEKNKSNNPSPFFIARFRGFVDGGSNKTPGSVSVVPEPTTIVLLGIGLIGLAGAEARRRRNKKTVDKS